MAATRVLPSHWEPAIAYLINIIRITSHLLEILFSDFRRCFFVEVKNFLMDYKLSEKKIILKVIL